MRKLLLVLAAITCVNAAFAGTPAQDCEAVLQANFAAMGAEDLEGLMQTISPTCPPRAWQEFRHEAEELFKETDVHLSLYGYQFLGVRGQFAGARVMQVTHVGSKGVSTPYRQASNLLPSDDSVVYIQVFKREPDGRWYLWTATEDEPVPKPRDAAVPVFGAGCEGGQCPPRVRLLME